MWLGARFSCWTNRLDPVDALERHPLVLLAAKLYRRRPVSGRREEEPAGVRAELLFFLESIAGVCPIFTRRENAPFATLDRLTGLFVQHYHAIGGGLQRARRDRIHGHPKSVVVGPQSKLGRLGAVAAFGQRNGKQRKRDEWSEHHA